MSKNRFYLSFLHFQKLKIMNLKKKSFFMLTFLPFSFSFRRNTNNHKTNLDLEGKIFSQIFNDHDEEWKFDAKSFLWISWACHEGSAK